MLLYYLLFFVLFFLSQQSHFFSLSVRSSTQLSIRRADRWSWDQLHEFYDDYVSFYQHQTNGSCHFRYFLYSLPQQYYYVNKGSASLKENEIRIFHSQFKCSSSLIVKRRYSSILVSSIPVLFH